MPLSSKFKLVTTFSFIYIVGPFACAFAIKPRSSCNSIRTSPTMAPNPDLSSLHSNIGNLERQPLISQNQHMGYPYSNNGYQNQRRRSSLAMIPDSRSQYGSDKNSTSSHPPTFLDATKRTRESHSHIESKELVPELPGEDTSVSRIIQQITSALSTFTNTLASSKKLQGRAILLLVAFLYGTLNVTLRGVYATEGPPAASVLSLVRQVLSVIAFIPLLVFSKEPDASDSIDKDIESGNENDTGIDPVKVRPMWMAALELAFWNFGAQVRYLSDCIRQFCCRVTDIIIPPGTYQCRPAF